jgi:hypothetical protein
MADKILEIERGAGGEFVLRFKPSACRVLPEAALEHFWTANKEMILALRGLLDVAIERTETRENPGERGGPKSRWRGTSPCPPSPSTLRSWIAGSPS